MIIEATTPDRITGYIGERMNGDIYASTEAWSILHAAKFSEEAAGAMVAALLADPRNEGWTFRALALGSGGTAENGGWSVID